jgi:hypothetical protein
VTRDEILAMPAGREMDALIAEKVMGVDFENHSRSIMKRLDATLPYYSTDIALAWSVVENVYERGLQKGYVRGLVAVMIHDYGETSLPREYHANAHQQSRAALIAVTEAS